MAPPKLAFQRYELKYYVSERTATEMVRLLQPYVKPDAHCRQSPSRSYAISSLYLDTPGLDFYYEKLDGIKHRRKLRIRGYHNDGSPVFLEIKSKLNRVIIKRRAPLSPSLVAAVLDGDDQSLAMDRRSPVEKQVLASFLHMREVLLLRPTLVVAYDREAYAGIDDERLRLTFDRHLRWVAASGPTVFPNGRDWVVSPNRQVILELKFDGRVPGWLKRTLDRFGLIAESISKYCQGAEACGLLALSDAV